MLQGQYPELLELRDRVELLQGYVDTVIFRDVVERHNARNIEALRRLVRQLLGSPGSAFSVHKFFNDLRSQGAAVGKDALHAMLSWLEDAFLVRLVPIDSKSERQRQVNPREIYPIDPGLIPVFDRSGKMNMGHALETAVLIELERRRCKVTYARTQSGKEVDFVARAHNGTATYIQVCADLTAEEVREREFAPLREILASQPKAQCLLLTSTSTDASIAQKNLATGVIVRPAWEWLLERSKPGADQH